jgi:D-alanyl-D-alanine carboxypeptidase
MNKENNSSANDVNEICKKAINDFYYKNGRYPEQEELDLIVKKINQSRRKSQRAAGTDQGRGGQRAVGQSQTRTGQREVKSGQARPRQGADNTGKTRSGQVAAGTGQTRPQQRQAQQSKGSNRTNRPVQTESRRPVQRPAQTESRRAGQKPIQGENRRPVQRPAQGENRRPAQTGNRRSQQTQTGTGNARPKRSAAPERNAKPPKEALTNRSLVAICVVLIVAVFMVVVIAKSLSGNGKKAGETNKSNGTVTITQALDNTNNAKQPDEAEPNDTTTDNTTPEVTPTPELETIDQSTLLDTNSIDYLKGLSSNGSVIEIIDGITYVEGQMIVNKTYSLPSDYVPEGHDGLDLSDTEYSYEGVTQEVWDAYTLMKNDMAEEGLSISPCSGYRSYNCQVGLWQAYADRDGAEAADTYSARAGYSEHQSGLCMDINSASDSFTSTEEGKWLDKNCWKYGFCIRFPEGKQEYTGYKYESWHVRYVGTELAEKLYNNGDWLSLEEYFGLQSAYNS